MTKRHNHYEEAFEGYLRELKIPYVAIDETKRPRSLEGTLKNLDFIVSPAKKPGLLVDVKGRRFPSGEKKKEYWRNWITMDDLESMVHWQNRFGPDFLALLVIAYDIRDEFAPVAESQLYQWKGIWYAFLAVQINDYLLYAEPLSIKWKTIRLPTHLFRQLAVPIDSYFSLENESNQSYGE